MELKTLDRKKLIEVALAQLGKPYKLGSKWRTTMNSADPIDCSGLTKWCYWRVGVDIPDGSQAQFDASDPTEHPEVGDLGFFITLTGDGPKTHHVGIYNSSDVIEARGEPYNKVILRPSAKWEAWSEFSGWRRVKGVK